ncbi:MAG: hypothetical protein JNM84_11465 [Planctomycetes bacterium]|nr:hypothetical protein [Planctomycetota bacterium]
MRTIALATGQPISEATVTLIEGRHRMLAVNDRRLLLSMKTDAEGTANLLHPELASAGGLGVIARAKGYVSTYAAVESSTRGELTLTLADERRATVSVREIDGKPVAGVRIELSAPALPPRIPSRPRVFQPQMLQTPSTARTPTTQGLHGSMDSEPGGTRSATNIHWPRVDS